MLTVAVSSGVGRSVTKRQAIKLFGSTSELARALGICPQAVSQWREGAIDEPRVSQVKLRAIELGLLKLKVITISTQRGRQQSSRVSAGLQRCGQ
jgi:transcriptional regulator with XRE-family HTH domain